MPLRARKVAIGLLVSISLALGAAAPRPSAPACEDLVKNSRLNGPAAAPATQGAWELWFRARGAPSCAARARCCPATCTCCERFYRPPHRSVPTAPKGPPCGCAAGVEPDAVVVPCAIANTTSADSAKNKTSSPFAYEIPLDRDDVAGLEKLWRDTCGPKWKDTSGWLEAFGSFTCSSPAFADKGGLVRAPRPRASSSAGDSKDLVCCLPNMVVASSGSCGDRMKWFTGCPCKRDPSDPNVGRVNKLQLTSNGLVGIIPACLGEGTCSASRFGEKAALLRRAAGDSSLDRDGAGGECVW